ncbi:hypothetical protein V6N11_026107 [Hibiscus sabdariffa]|uniref:Uncharacterized protein n=1 Tax=Hibiscus sabdariffa TaxID=183260 RepID=A0ABR2SUR1_9ROSI
MAREGERVESGDQDQKPNFQRKDTDANKGLAQEEDDLVTRKENKEKEKNKDVPLDSGSSSDSESKVDGQGTKKEGVLNYRDAVEESSGADDSDKDKGGPTDGPKRNIDYGANIGDMDQAEQVLDVTGSGVNPVLEEKAQVSWVDRIDHLVIVEHGLSPGDEGGTCFARKWNRSIRYGMSFALNLVVELIPIFSFSEKCG